MPPPKLSPGPSACLSRRTTSTQSSRDIYTDRVFPDARFLDYVRRRYGIQHVVSLFGPSEVYARAKDLGMKITILDWRKRGIPAQDIKKLLDLFDRKERVLVHCKAGRDRTGFVIASYRILRQHWPLLRAVEEMEAHGHSRRNRLKTTRELRELLRELTVKFPDDFPTIPSPSLQASRF